VLVHALANFTFFQFKRLTNTFSDIFFFLFLKTYSSINDYVTCSPALTVIGNQMLCCAFSMFFFKLTQRGLLTLLFIVICNLRGKLWLHIIMVFEKCPKYIRMKLACILAQSITMQVSLRLTHSIILRFTVNTIIV